MERLPTPVFWSGEFHGLYSPGGCKELDTTDFHFHFLKKKKKKERKAYFVSQVPPEKQNKYEIDTQIHI